MAAQGWGQSPKLVSPQLLISVLSSWWSVCWPVSTPPHPPLLPHRHLACHCRWGVGAWASSARHPRSPYPSRGTKQDT